MSAALPLRVRLAYALPAFVIAVPMIPVFINLPTFYGVELGLGLATTGLIMLLARLFDTVSDPLMGIVSDRYRWRGLRRKPWITLGAVICGMALFNLLIPPAEVSDAGFLLWSVLLYAGWTMVAIPYLAWGAELTSNYHQRTGLTGWREGCGLLGILAAGTVMAVTADWGWSSRDANAALAWLTLVSGLLAFPIMLLYLDHGLGAPQQVQGLLILIYFAAAVGGIPLWLWLGRRQGKHRAWAIAMIAACSAFVLVPLIPIGGFYGFAIVCLVTGMALGADMALPPAIQADVVDVDTLRHHRPRAGLFFSLWSMATKLALAVAVGTALPGLDWLGFDPENVTENSRFNLLVIYALAPVVLKGSVVLLMWNFPLTQHKHDVVQRRLQRRNGAAGPN
jgi:Na+/melibiose symporter-like transporter